MKNELKGNKALFNKIFEETARLIEDLTLTRISESDFVLREQVIKKGEKVKIALSEINKDPNIFTEPNKFNPFRSNIRESLAFGTGDHVCLGRS